MSVARRLLPIVLAPIIAHLFVACGGPSRPDGDRDQQGRPIEAVSSVPPNPQALQQDRDVVAVQRLERVESVGDCAPRYKSGDFGMCINGKPCRGIGVVDAAGVVSCTCYGVPGGCAESERCDDRKVACVSDDEPPFDRTRTR